VYTSIDVGRNVSKPGTALTSPYLRCKLLGGNWVIAGATDRSHGISTNKTLNAADPVTCVLRSPDSIYRMASSGAHTIAVDDPLWGAANGLVDNVYSVGAEFLGFAQSIAAATAGAIVEVLACGNLRMIEVQATTVSASDTIVTGLSKVLVAFANLDSAPVLTCDRATASIGDQAGTPVAGSVLLQTWMPTSNANPTPVPATAFGKKVNLVVWGY
jgi:hypothetical protein